MLAVTALLGTFVAKGRRQVPGLPGRRGLVLDERAVGVVWLKGADRRKPFSILCPDLSDVARYGIVSKFAYRTMHQLAPGPFTFVLTATRLVPEMMTTKQKQVGIRIPSSPWVQLLLAALGGPIVNSSATDSTGAALVDPRDIQQQLGHALELILDGGIQASEPSTVVSLIDDDIEVLRQGQGVLPGV